MLYKGKSIFGFGISKSRNRLSYQDVSKCYLQRNRPITPRHIAKKKRSETDLSNSNKFSIWQHRNIRTK